MLYVSNTESLDPQLNTVESCVLFYPGCIFYCPFLEKTYLVPKRGTLWMVEIEEDIEAVDVGGTCFIFDLRFIVWPFKFTF